MTKILHTNLAITLSNLIVAGNGGGGDHIVAIGDFADSLEEWFDAAVEDIADSLASSVTVKVGQ